VLCIVIVHPYNCSSNTKRRRTSESNNKSVLGWNLRCSIPKCLYNKSTAVTNPTLYSTESRPTTPPATRHAHVVILYLYPPPFPHPHLIPKFTHLRPTAPTIPFYVSIFCVLLWYYTICCVPRNLNSPIDTFCIVYCF